MEFTLHYDVDYLLYLVESPVLHCDHVVGPLETFPSQLQSPRYVHVNGCCATRGNGWTFDRILFFSQ